uniref:ACT domain-containing protein n=1 Tax=Timema shepardi TaxID=629360 RepID=A0A7R9BB30_TIMSH|nr:unnamed protein product [Timema shepardi]
MDPTLVAGGNYIKEGRDSAKSLCLIFSPEGDEVGALAKSLILFQKHGVNLLHIESRSSLRFPGQYEFMVECAPCANLGAAIENLREGSSYFNIITRNHKDNREPLGRFLITRNHKDNKVESDSHVMEFRHNLGDPSTRRFLTRGFPRGSQNLTLGNNLKKASQGGPL